MNNLKEYIIEKLKLNKDSEENISLTEKICAIYKDTFCYKKFEEDIIKFLNDWCKENNINDDECEIVGYDGEFSSYPADATSSFNDIVDIDTYTSIAVKYDLEEGPYDYEQIFGSSDWIEILARHDAMLVHSKESGRIIVYQPKKK